MATIASVPNTSIAAQFTCGRLTAKCRVKSISVPSGASVAQRLIPSKSKLRQKRAQKVRACPPAGDRVLVASVLSAHAGDAPSRKATGQEAKDLRPSRSQEKTASGQKNGFRAKSANLEDFNAIRNDKSLAHDINWSGCTRCALSSTRSATCCASFVLLRPAVLAASSGPRQGHPKIRTDRNPIIK